MERSIRAAIAGGTGTGTCFHISAAAQAVGGGSPGIQDLLDLMDAGENVGQSDGIEAAMERLGRDILSDAVERLRTGNSTDGAQAILHVCGEVEGALRQAGNEALAQRADDIHALGLELLRRLSGAKGASWPRGAVLVAEELSVYDALRAVDSGAAAAVVRRYSPVSHAALLLREAGIPVAHDLEDVSALCDGQLVRVDGAAQEIVLDPKDGAQGGILAPIGEEELPLADGTVFRLSVNAGGSLNSIPEGISIGLLRTEYAYLSSGEMDEERLAAEYAALARTRPFVTIRLLDIGADKLPSGPDTAKEENPALGLRGVRALLRNPGLLRTQLRAILRASASGNIRILIPMVTLPEEIAAVRNQLHACMEELRGEGRAFCPEVPLGIMIETPAAAIEAETMADAADFGVIGTNDLAQYVMAADRCRAELAAYASWRQSAVLRLTAQVIRAFAARGKRVCVCGEMAADPEGIQMLVEMGLREASVSPGSHGIIADCIRSKFGKSGKVSSPVGKP